MNGLTFTKQTSTVALVFFTLYFFYGMMYIPFTQYLVSLAVGAIAFGMTESYEIATIALLIMNFLFPVMGGPVQTVQGYSEGFMARNPAEVSERIIGLQKAHQGVHDPVGVGSKMSEGFEDAQQPSTDLTQTQPTTNTTPVTATSQPEPATKPEEKKEEAPKPPTTISEQGVPPANQPATAGFQDNSSLFKLGQIPTDTKGGFHMDVGTTVTNALSALKPDQIKAMTADTKQLIETQKSLMGMLQTFQPMMQEGKQMMNTFNQMFAPTAGAATQ
jgi:hypothetical protein